MEKMTRDLEIQTGKIDVPRFEQKKRLWCGPAVLQSLLAFNNYSVSQEEIVNEIGLDNGCFIQDLGTFALTKNINVKIFSYDVMYIDPTWKDLTSIQINQKIIDYISNAKLSEISEEFYVSLIRYISNGGEIEVRLPDKKYIKSLLDQEIPVLVLVNSNSFYERARLDSKGNSDDVMGKPGGHFLLLIGHDSGYFLVIDPSYDNPISKIEEDRFMFSLSIWGGWMMVLNGK